MNGNLISDVHLIKLVDTAYAIVCQHQRSCFNAELTSLRLLGDGCSQTSSTAAFPRCVDSARQEAGHILKKLGLGTAGVTDNQHIDVPSQTATLWSVFVNSTHQHQEDGLLYFNVSIHCRGNAAEKLLIQPWVLFHLPDFLHLLWTQVDTVKFIVIVRTNIGKPQALAGGLDSTSQEHKPVVQIPHAKCFESSDSLTRSSCGPCTAGTGVSCFGSISWSGQCSCVWHCNQSSRKNQLVACSCHLYNVIAQDNVQTSW
mmetsp:Transcript_9191/g.55820  ORF Transcript_9191/g.55820 Transcript_9191/m.55820 type:complete len:257 (+) Transcript_9191:1252-2022(+)